MQIEQRIQAFHQLGHTLRILPSEKLEAWCLLAKSENAWFTSENVTIAVRGISDFLHEATLREWLGRYPAESVQPKKVAIIMAGNIPLVGFHDFLSVLLSGHNVVMKMSSKDSQLFKVILQTLLTIEPAFQEKIHVVDGLLKEFDAVIATGSDNSARYFDYYFNKYPNIIRKNRTSCAVLTGNETQEDMQALGSDVFSYFGLGCRNVSKVFVPVGYNFSPLLDNWASFSSVIDHHKYNNNYDYQKAILLVNQQNHLDTGHLLLCESDKLVSPIAVLFFEYYTTESDIINTLDANRHKLQCIVGAHAYCTVPFGQTQQPKVWDYADDVDTLQFLTTLN